MGDFNDNSNNNSLKLLSKQSSYYEKKTSKPLFTPMESMQKKGLGSLAYRDRWFLFDPEDNPKTIDDDYTPAGRLGWNEELLNQKIDHLASVISEIGKKETHKAPSSIGCS